MPSRSETTAFALDAAGRITEQVHANGTKVLPSYSGERGWPTAVEHRTSGGALLARYEWTRDSTGRISERQGTTTRTYHADHLGSTRGLTSGTQAVT